MKSNIRPRSRAMSAVSFGDIGTFVVGQPFDWMWRACAFEPALDGGGHEIAYHLAGDTGVRHGRPSDDLAVAGIKHEQDQDDLAIPGSEHPRIFECSAMTAPSCVRLGRRAEWRSSVSPWFCTIRSTPAYCSPATASSTVIRSLGKGSRGQIGGRRIGAWPSFG